MYAIYGTGEYGTILITLGISLESFMAFDIEHYHPEHVSKFGGISGYEMNDGFKQILDDAGFSYWGFDSDYSYVRTVLVVDLNKFDIKKLPSQWGGIDYIKHHTLQKS